MPLLGVGNVLAMVVKPTVHSIGVPVLVEVFEAVEAVIMPTQVIMSVIMSMIMSIDTIIDIITDN